MGYKFTAEALDGSGISVVQCDREDVPAEIADADLVVPLMTPLPRDLLQKAPKLKTVLQYGVGLEAVDVAAATELGVYVSNIPSKSTGNAASCAEMAIFLTLATLRHVKAMQAAVQGQQLGAPMGTMLQGKSVLILGWGHIAVELATRLQCFGVSMTALRRSEWSKSASSEAAAAAEALLADKGVWPRDASRLASTADIVVVTCSQDASNRGMVGKEFLASCKDGVRLVNVARGGLIDHDAALEGLKAGKIGGMGLDVHPWEPFDPEDPLAVHPAVFLTPHVAGVTEESYRAMAAVVAEEAKRLEAGQAPRVQINSEEAMRRSGSLPRVASAVAGVAEAAAAAVDETGAS